MSLPAIGMMFLAHLLFTWWIVEREKDRVCQRLRGVERELDALQDDIGCLFEEEPDGPMPGVTIAAQAAQQQQPVKQEVDPWMPTF